MYHKSINADFQNEFAATNLCAEGQRRFYYTSNITDQTFPFALYLHEVGENKFQ